MTQVVMKLNGVEYEVKAPSVREYLAIEANKISLAKGDYGGLCMAGTVSSALALDLIDMVAVLTVMCPELEKDPTKGLKTGSILEINMTDIKPIFEAYNKDVRSFVNAYMKDFRNLLPKPDKKDAKPTKTNDSDPK